MDPEVVGKSFGEVSIFGFPPRLLSPDHPVEN